MYLKIPYLLLKWLTYGEYFDGANIYGCECNAPDAEGVAVFQLPAYDTLMNYDLLICERGKEPSYTPLYLVSYGRLYALPSEADIAEDPILEQTRDILLSKLDSDGLWFTLKHNGRDWVFIPNPEGDYAYYIITAEE